MMTIGKKHREPDKEAVDCLPCDIPAFCRNNYYTGKLLTQRDLLAEQRYFIDKMRLHTLQLHGWGVVCGLRVKPHPHCPDLKIVIEPGLAIDGCGREIRVLEEIEIDLPKRPEPPPNVEDPCPPDEIPTDPKEPDGDRGPKGRREAEDEDEDGNEDELEREEPKQEGPALGGKGDPATDEEDGPAPQCPPETNLYLCIRYVECGTELQPAPFDECACNGNEKRPNRICEGVEVDWEVDDHAPRSWERIRCLIERTDSDDCADHYTGILEGCLVPGWPKCIPLAVVREYEPGTEVSEDLIDNWTYRPLLPSTRILDRVIRCILDKLPTRKLTRIEDTGWLHEGEYSWKDFRKLFIGDDDLPQGLEITFDDQVRIEGLSEYTYQAFAVRRTEKGHRGGYVEAVPAQVWASDDRTKFYLRLDPDYVESCLRGVTFDLFLTLHCDLIVDDRGRPVDGDLQATVQTDGDYAVVFPTGDGIPGGRFKSWFRVLGDSRRRAK